MGDYDEQNLDTSEIMDEEVKYNIKKPKNMLEYELKYTNYEMIYRTDTINETYPDLPKYSDEFGLPFIDALPFAHLKTLLDEKCNLIQKKTACKVL